MRMSRWMNLEIFICVWFHPQKTNYTNDLFTSTLERKDMYDKENIFAKIIRKEVPCEIIFEDEHVIAFNDLQPAAPVHVLVLPKGQYISFDDFSVVADAEVVGHFFATIRNIACDLNLDKTGYRLIMNHGSDASQTIPHFHVHILGGEKLGGLVAKDRLER